MTYHAIGKEEWQKLPGMFYNAELAETLDQDQIWWCHTEIKQQSKFQVYISRDKNGAYQKITVPRSGTPELYTMEYFIRYTSRDGTFKKVMKPA